MALHALAYCERLFYLEEVEEIRVADHRVYAGRTLHETELPDDGGELVNVTLESECWGLKGKLDYLRYRDGHAIPFEHKRGRSNGDEAWESDRLQVTAYAALLAEHLDRPIPEGRIRYHATNKTVRVPIDKAAHAAVPGGGLAGGVLCPRRQGLGGGDTQPPFRGDGGGAAGGASLLHQRPEADPCPGHPPVVGRG